MNFLVDNGILAAYVEAAGFSTGPGKDLDYVAVRLSGTQTERIVQRLGQKRNLQLHLCGQLAQPLRQAWHWMCVKQMGIGPQRRRQNAPKDWRTNLAIHSSLDGSEDELARLRERAESKGNGVGDAKKTTLSGGDTDDAKSKEKKKKSKKGG